MISHTMHAHFFYHYLYLTVTTSSSVYRQTNYHRKSVIMCTPLGAPPRAPAGAGMFGGLMYVFFGTNVHRVFRNSVIMCMRNSVTMYIVYFRVLSMQHEYEMNK
jgi:hypothetical protein